MTKAVLLALTTWVLLLCAPLVTVHAGNAPDSPPAEIKPAHDGPGAANAPGSSARLTELAHRLAASDPAEPSTSLIEAGRGTTPTGLTPLLTDTPLRRRSDPGADTVPAVGSRGWLLKTLTALGVVIGLALLVRMGYARLGGKVATSQSPVVEVLSRTNVAPRSHVLLLRVGGRVLVVSDSSAGMRTLASVDDPEEVADLLGAVSAAKPASISRGFAQLFQRFNEEHEQQDKLDDAGSPEQRVGRVRESMSDLLARVRGLGRGEGVR